jgi:hypothetical protein
MSNPNDPNQGYPNPGHPPPPQGGFPPPPYGGHGAPPGSWGNQGGWGPPPRGSGGQTALIIGLVFLIFVLVMGATLYFTGVLDRWFGSPGETVATGTPAPGAGTATTPAPRPITVPRNGMYLVGTWGPNCPQLQADSVTLNSDGTLQGPNGSGTWTIDQGSTVTVTVNGRSRAAHWGMQAGGRAAIVRPTGGSPTRVSRC